MRYTLKALVLLHKNRIVHRDINISNCVVNHFCADTREEWNGMRKELGRDGRLIYAMIDFDIAIMFPPHATSEECRLPHNLSWDGNCSRPNDTMQGELDYDPLAFDVGCLGVEFCHLFQHLTPMVPMLAPLMDQMTRRDLSCRFTASQALKFLESFASQITPEVLQACPPPYCYNDAPYDQYNRWRGLPEIFCRNWAHFRESPPPFQVRLLRHICEHSWGLKFVQVIRKLVRLAVLWQHGSIT
ncbi:hypothetical protein BD410DRAFT_143397 [Rickenella mellea]|uniref:Protein kinase domain-containing protein n=1 Tax=Rickenella mellea TaxID=50990 RepID=A0A4Y7Q9U5_9AGAM|nr:hypothetical protein BD410DRAFT_143397 [Rickenella mellea]